MSRLLNKPFSLLVLSLAMISHAEPVSGVQKTVGRRFALLVGVENYRHARLREPSPLQYPVDDVLALGKLLKEDDYEVTILCDDTGKDDPLLTPTGANIENHLQRILKNCQPEDTFLLALSGHGLQFSGNKDAFYCPLDARPFASETASLVSITKVYEEMEKSFAGVKVILIDACRNDPDPSRGRGLDADSAPPPPKGVAALFSCSAGQRAFEHDQFKHGVFFHHVLEGLQGKAADSEGEITFEGLSIYVRRNVPRTIRKLIPDREQLPNMKADLIGEPPVLVRVTSPVVPAKPELAKPTPEKPKMEKSPSTPPASPPSPPLKVTTVTPTPKMQKPTSTKRPTATKQPTGAPPPLAISPFNAQQARQHQEAWAMYLGTEVEIENSIGMKLTLIPASEFMMGSEKYGVGDDEKPVHAVRLTKPYFLGTTEVTQGEWEAVMGTTPWKGTRNVNEGADYAATHVNHEDAEEFCWKLSEKEGKEYRLPTEAEWEHACRAGTKSTYHFGDDESDLGEYAWYGGNSSESRGEQYVHRVGLKKPNPFGLRDMHGNVWEWCSDLYDGKYYANSPQENPEGASSGSLHLFRGGSWYDGPAFCRSADRFWSTPSFRGFDLGFRVARVP